MLLGVAIGDALGATTEGKLPVERQRIYGEITDYVPGKRSANRSIGFPTDDTQLTYWTLKQLIRDGGLVPDNLAKQFCKHHIIGIGGSTRSFIANYKEKRMPWYTAGVDSLGNGALMRISPIIVPYITTPHPSMYADAALDAMITHNSFGNIAACVSFINILWNLIRMSYPPAPNWWIDTYCWAAQSLEGNTKYKTRSVHQFDYEGPLWLYTEKVVSEALRKGMTVSEACNWWGSGSNLFETVPSVIYILATHAENPEQAMIRAVNDTKDNDTIAAIVGAAIGALHGTRSFPERWVHGLSGRTRAGTNDSGEIFKLILAARNTF